MAKAGVLKVKPKLSDKEQSERLKQNAWKLDVDESKKFEAAISKIVKR